MALAAFISNIWAGFSAASTPSSRRRRRVVTIDPDSIEPINHWFPGIRNKKQPRRLVETPTAGHWPEYRVAKKGIGKGRKRCGECGALVKEGNKTFATSSKRVGNSGAQEKSGRQKETKAVARRLRGRIVNYAE